VINMRILSLSLAVSLLGALVVAQAPSAPKGAPAPKAGQAAPKAAPPPAIKLAPTTRPAPLAQVMRGILFPNSNLLFDVQQNDPAVPKQPATGATGGSTSETFANVYTGWQVVENAATALDEAVDLIQKPGRLCENGKPVPLANADFKKFAADLRVVARKARAAAQVKDRDKLTDIDNDLSDACANCHEVYRDAGPAGSPLRCVPAQKK
jgi:hypothetical protein